jgi:hypothetical protein
MIVGPGWPLLGLIAIGIAAFSLIPGCGLAVVENASSNEIQLDAPALVQPDPAVEARAVALPTVSPGSARRALRRDTLRVRSVGCAGVTSGSGFALDAHIVLASRDVLPAAGRLKAGPRGGRATGLGSAQVFHLGKLGIARVSGRLRSGSGKTPSFGASVAMVAGPLSSPRLVPGVVVDEIAGAPFGVEGRVLRLSSRLPKRDAGGPVVDAKGRIVAVAFTTDPATGFAVAVPVGTLRSLVARRALEAAPACDA